MKTVRPFVRFVYFVDRWHWLWLALASPLLLFPAPARSPAMLVVPLVWLAGWIARPRAPLARTPLNTPLLVVLLMVLVSLWATPDLAFSLPKVAGMVLGAGVFFAVARESERPVGLALALAALVGLGVAFAVTGLLGTQWGAKISFLAPITSRLGMQVSGLPGAEEGINPNTLAGTLIWVVPVAVWTLAGYARAVLFRPSSARPARRILEWLAGAGLLAATALLLGVYMLTQSRGGYIGLAVAAVVTLWLAVSRLWRWTLIGLAVIALIGGSILAWQTGAGDVAQRVLFGGQAEAAAAGADSAAVMSTLEGRLEIWSRALYGIQDFPFTGMGMNMFRRVMPVLYPTFLISPDADIGHAHDEFLQSALDLGLPGLIAFGSLYLIAAWMLCRIWSSAQAGSAIRALVLGLTGGLLGHAIFGLTDTVALGARTGVLFWMLLGLVCGLFARVAKVGAGLKPAPNRVRRGWGAAAIE